MNNYLKFFSHWNRESAWVYGLILGDGYVSEKIDNRIGICGNYNTVLKFENLLGIKNKEMKRDNIYHSYFHSKDTLKWFKERGIVGKKSHKLPWPKDIPEKYMWDFARGLIDTDGSFRFDNPEKNGRRGRLKLNLGYCSSTKVFCEKFANFLELNSKVIEGRKKFNNTECIYYTFKMGFEKSISVLDKVYDCPIEIRNEERYQKYIKAKKIFEKYKEGCVKCGKKIHTKNLCMEHMWQEKLKDKKPLYCHCGKKALTRKSGLCSAHYSKQRRLKE